MTRQGKTRGLRMTAGGKLDDEHVLARAGLAERDEARVKAAWYLVRTGNGDLDVLGALGLACDVCGNAKPGEVCTTCLNNPPPKVERRRPARPVVRPGCCPLCNNPMPRSGVCRKRLVCRAAAVRAEMEAL